MKTKKQIEKRLKLYEHNLNYIQKFVKESKGVNQTFFYRCKINALRWVLEKGENKK